MQSCKRATELMSQQLDRELSASEKIGLKMHLLMCRHCRKCEQQLGIIHQLSARRGDTPQDGE